MSERIARKILLTSAGFETKTIRDAFLNLAGKEPKEIQVLFIPTAAIFPAAIAMLPKCMDDLLSIGIPPENIKVFDLHRALRIEEWSKFDAVYFTGGSPQYLLGRINNTGFNISLNTFVDNGGIYVGVSAGSIVAAGNIDKSLGYLKATLDVHMETGSDYGVFDNDTVTHIQLTDNAILISEGIYKII